MMMSGGQRQGTLVFVGLGLDDESGISTMGLKEIGSSDTVFAEDYTSRLAAGSIEKLEHQLNKQIQLLSRTAVEDGNKILDACTSRKVAFLVTGDPMTATTHIDLRLRAAKKGIQTRIVHGASALTAVPGLLG